MAVNGGVGCVVTVGAVVGYVVGDIVGGIVVGAGVGRRVLFVGAMVV